MRYFEGNLKRAVHTQQAINIKLEMFCKKEGSKIPSFRIQTLIIGYRNCFETIFVKGGSTKYRWDFSVGVSKFMNLINCFDAYCTFSVNFCQ